MNEKQFELSRYELNRKPQELILDDTEIKVQRKSLNALLMCPICLDVLRNTMTTKECLHRFCSECITTALRSGNKECPTCRKVFLFKILILLFQNCTLSDLYRADHYDTIPFSMRLLPSSIRRARCTRRSRTSF